MGTSSAYTVGLLKTSVKASNEKIAQLATVIERDKLAGKVGYQDQYICAVGGFRVVKFFNAGIQSRVVDASWLNKYLLLLDTGRYRAAGEVVASQLERVKQNQGILQELKDLVTKGEEAIIGKDYKEFGLLLDEAWRLKKALSDRVSTTEIDGIYDKAMSSGAIGGKLLGAGGGGFILFLAEPDRHDEIAEALGLYRVEFKFENEGSQVIYDSSQKVKE